MADRTTILIAHRTSTLISADRIVVLHEGVIAEDGSHEELLALGGIYANFYRHQLLREQLDDEEDAAPSNGDGEQS